MLPYDPLRPTWEINMKTSISIGVKKVSKYAELPEYGTEQSACFDLKACLIEEYDKDKYITLLRKIKIYDTNNDKPDSNNLNLLDPNEPFGYVILPGHRYLIPTGLIFDIPEGYSIRLHPRSGSALKFGITLGNAEGVIDSCYTQETFVMIQNTSGVPYTIKHGDRICQGELVKKQDISFVEVDAVDKETDRIGGFGSTGIR